MNCIRIKFTYKDGTRPDIIARPHHASPEGKALARRMRQRLGH